MGSFGNSVITFVGNVLTFLHDLIARVSFLEAAAWGWAIIMLTLFVRVLLLPLAIKQTRSMRAMQTLQPQMKELQKKYKVDRELMRKDPERYRAQKQKLNEEMMALYQREGANPLASCLPLLAQAPVFIALFWTLREFEPLRGQEFYFFTTVGEGGLEMLVSQAGWPGWLLIVLMSGTMFWSMRQMNARNAAQMGDNPMAQQQKILLYVMPVFLAVISFQFPLGILLYWVTTNAWQVAQQAIILREIERGDAVKAETPKGNGPDTGTSGSRSRGATSGRQPRTDGDEPDATGEDSRGKDSKGGGSRDKDPGGKDPGDKDPKGRDPKSGESTGKDAGSDATPRPRRGSGSGRGTNKRSPKAGQNGRSGRSDKPSGGGSSRRRDHLPRRTD